MAEIKKQAFYDGYKIYVDMEGSVHVEYDGCEVETGNTKDVLKDISKKTGFSYEDKWNTRQLGGKLIDFLKSDFLKSKHNEKLNAILDLLVKNDVTDSVFSADKEAIKKIFEETSVATKSNILIRLTLIDSMYSTQMGRRYYALEELAEVLFILSVNNNGLKQLFVDFANDPGKYVDKFNYQINNKESNLWSECYGIGKDGSEKGIAISLISKYAYFETEFKFPIYDSIACEMYPVIWERCGFEGKVARKFVYKGLDGKIDGKQTIINFIKAINSLISEINHPRLNYDFLDRYLWHVGKIRRGNLSLILTREEYEETIRKYPVKEVQKKDDKKVKEYFNIDDVDLSKLSYLSNNDLLRMFFEMAKDYGHKK